MGNAAPTLCQVNQDGSVMLLARIDNWSTSGYITQALVSSIAYTVKRVDDDDPSVETAVTGHTAIAVSKATSVFDTLQGVGGVDQRWTVDTTGYNFRYTVSSATTSAFAVKGATYRVYVTFTMATAGEPPIVVPFECEAI